MTAFWIAAIIMIVAVLGLLTPALLGRRRAVEQDRNDQNVRIARERLQELETERQSGVITETQFDQARDELEQALLNDVTSDGAQETGIQAATGRWTLVLLIIMVPALSGSLYLYLGQPGALSAAGSVSKAQLPADHPAISDAGKLPTVEDMLVRLERRLQQQPDDAKGWLMLGRSYMALGRFPEAVGALEKAHRLSGSQPVVMLAYADALAMSNGGRVSGKPFELVKATLAVAPDEPTALWLAGMGYEEQGDHKTAIRHWKKLETQLAGDPGSLMKVQQLIASAEQKTGSRAVIAGGSDSNAPAVVPGAVTRLTVMVSLDPSFRDEASPTDTVFVFARAMQGPPMPLAVVRRQVSDLPIEVTLDDSMSMMPGMKLSSFPELRVGARVSKSGNAMPQSGDLSGEVASVTVAGTSPVQVVINTHIQ